MSLALGIDELLGYTNGERGRWEQWIAAQPPAALETPLQRAGRFPTVWRLMDHIFVVERRHTQRLQQESPLAQQTGVADADVRALFAFGRAAREELTRFIHATPDAEMGRKREFHFQDSSDVLTPRKLVFHILFHEIRHWAQIATALRNAGFVPPGDHDLFYSSAME
jgi:uncharacterized damage-inducible protein DinB